MNLFYHPWLRLNVSNNYFQKGVCSYFELLPVGETIDQVKNYHLLIKKVAGQFTFYAGTKTNKSFDIKQHFNSLGALYFQLMINDPLFTHYTDIPFLKTQQLFRFDNAKNKKQPYLLHHQKFVSKDDIVSYRSKVFSIELPKKQVHLTIKDIHGKVVFEQNIDGSIQKIVQVNLMGFEDGFYELNINDSQLDTIYLLDEPLNDKCRGIIRIEMNSIKTQNNNDLKYQVAFNAQSVFWQYQIVIHHSRKINVVDMKVVGTKEDEYVGPHQQMIVGEQIAQVFTSVAPLKLQNSLTHNPLLHVVYTNDFSSRKNQLQLKLPNPKVDQVRSIKEGPNKKSFLFTTIVYV